MDSVEWIGDGDEWSDSAEYDGPAFYVVDGNGIVAGPFDDEGEGFWWSDKAKRVH